MSFCYINVETKMKTEFFFSNLKKFTSRANEFLLHKCRNKNKKWFFFNPKNFTSPANKILLRKCRNIKKRKNNFYFQIWKNLQVQLMSFYYINIETIRIWKNEFFFQTWKNIQVQLMNFCYIKNVETKMKK